MINAEFSKHEKISNSAKAESPHATTVATINKFTNPYWLTFSPDGATEPINADRFVDKWRTKFLKFVTATKNGVYVMEVQPGTGRFHWHIMLDVTDMCRLMKFIKGIAYEPIRQMQYKIYKGFPAGGVEYLFKDIPETMLHLKRNTPIILHNVLEQLWEDVQDNRKHNKHKKSHFDIVNPGVPKCFRPCKIEVSSVDSSNSSDTE